MTRQRKYQIRRLAEGNCRQCGKPLQHYKEYCDTCAVKNRKQERLRKGLSSKRKGSAGRPAIIPD